MREEADYILQINGIFHPSINPFIYLFSNEKTRSGNKMPLHGCSDNDNLWDHDNAKRQHKRHHQEAEEGVCT